MISCGREEGRERARERESDEQGGERTLHPSSLIKVFCIVERHLLVATEHIMLKFVG